MLIKVESLEWATSHLVNPVQHFYDKIIIRIYGIHT